ncbi:MAG: carbohydrate-binding protein [Candidatus Riflebacteria bacterium]|nr:carbohydrate-binding protein [Candidatus Riflebacteria bacterium]
MKAICKNLFSEDLCVVIRKKLVPGLIVILLSISSSIAFAFSIIEAEDYASMKGIKAGSIVNEYGKKAVGSAHNKDWLEYDNFDFGQAATNMKIRVSSIRDGGLLEFRIDSIDGRLIGEYHSSNTGGWDNYVTKTVPLQKVSGIHNLFILFKYSGRLAISNIDWFQLNNDGDGNDNDNNVSNDEVKDYSDTNSGLRPSKFNLFGRNHYFQIPPNPKGTVLFLHGSGRTSKGFWPSTPSAPECNAFPEDISHTKQILLQGYAMLAPTPNDERYSWTHAKGDDKQIAAIVSKFLNEHNLENDPLYVMGASSGGGMAINLPELFQNTEPKLKVSGIVCEVATNQSPMDEDGIPSARNFPPVVYVVMERDTESRKEATVHVKELKKNNIPAAVVLSPIRQITPAYYSNRMATVNPTLSEKIVDALKNSGILDQNGYLKSDPHASSEWMAQVKKVVPNTKEFSMSPFSKSQIAQATGVAYARHEHVSDYTTAAIKYFESGGEDDMDELVEQYKVDITASMKLK